MLVHQVQPGEGLSSLAELYGFAPETIWNDPANAELKALRTDGNVLMAGDAVTIPDKQPKSVAVMAGATYRFRRRGVPAQVRLRLTLNGTPRANQFYLLQIDGVSRYGKTNADGILQSAVSPRARHGRIVIGPDRQEILIDFGYLDPVSEVTGVQARLINLGYFVGSVTGSWDAATRSALRRFQSDHGAAASGEADEATLQLLLALHDQACGAP